MVFNFGAPLYEHFDNHEPEVESDDIPDIEAGLESDPMEMDNSIPDSGQPSSTCPDGSPITMVNGVGLCPINDNTSSPMVNRRERQVEPTCSVGCDGNTRFSSDTGEECNNPCRVIGPEPAPTPASRPDPRQEPESDSDSELDPEPSEERFSDYVEHFDNGSSSVLSRCLNVNLLLKAVLFACLFYILAHNDSRKVILKYINVGNQNYLYVASVLYFLVYMVLNILV